MPTTPQQPDATERFAIWGQVGAAEYPVWIKRHAARLGLTGRILTQTDQRLDVVLSGPPDLLDAMALGCSLGPQEVWVDKIDRIALNAASTHESTSRFA